VASALFALFYMAAGVVFPLWATRDVGLRNDQWATLVSFRYAGVAIGMVLLGPLSNRLGAARTGAAAIMGLALMMLGMSSSQPLVVWLSFPLFGPLMSTGLLNVTALIQQVSARRQGLANSVCSSVVAAVGIVAPTAATALAVRVGGYPGLFVVFAAVLVVVAGVVWSYPGQSRPAPLRGWGREVRAALHSHRALLTNGPLMLVLHLSSIGMYAMVGVTLFAAIRFTKELGLSDQRFGLLASIAAALTLGITALAALFLDRWPLRVVASASLGLAGASAITLGLTDSTKLAAAAWLLYIPVIALAALPVTMWIARVTAPEAHPGAYAMAKLWAAVYLIATPWLAGRLERWMGIKPVFVTGGAIAVLAAITVSRLPEPPRPGGSETEEGVRHRQVDRATRRDHSQPFARAAATRWERNRRRRGRTRRQS